MAYVSCESRNWRTVRDGDTLERMKGEKVLIAGKDKIRTACDGAFEDTVIIWIAAGGHDKSGVNELAFGAHSFHRRIECLGRQLVFAIEHITQLNEQGIGDQGRGFEPSQRFKETKWGSTMKERGVADVRVDDNSTHSEARRSARTSLTTFTAYSSGV